MSLPRDTPEQRLGGLTYSQRQRVFRIMKQLREASINFHMRLNDSCSPSLRSRTLSAKKMMTLSRDLYRMVART